MSEPNQGFPPQLPPEPGQPAPQQEAPPNYGSPQYAQQVPQGVPPQPYPGYYPPAPAPSNSRRKTEDLLLNVLLYLGSLLLIGSAALFITSVTSEETIGLRVAALGFGSALFYGAGLIIYKTVARLRLASYSFTGTGLALLPLTGIATYHLGVWDNGRMIWLITSLVGTVAIVLACTMMRNRIMAYLLVSFFISDALAATRVAELPFVWYFVLLTVLATILGLILRLNAKLVPTGLREGLVESSRIFVPVTAAVVFFFVSNMSFLEVGVVFAIMSVYALVFFTLDNKLDYYIQLRIYPLLAVIYFCIELHNLPLLFAFLFLAVLLSNTLAALLCYPIIMQRKGYDQNGAPRLEVVGHLDAALSIAAAGFTLLEATITILSHRSIDGGNVLERLLPFFESQNNGGFLPALWVLSVFFLVGMLPYKRILPANVILYTVYGVALLLSLATARSDGAFYVCFAVIPIALLLKRAPGVEPLAVSIGAKVSAFLGIMHLSYVTFSDFSGRGIILLMAAVMAGFGVITLSFAHSAQGAKSNSRIVEALVYTITSATFLFLRSVLSFRYPEGSTEILTAMLYSAALIALTALCIWMIRLAVDTASANINLGARWALGIALSGAAIASVLMPYYLLSIIMLVILGGTIAFLGFIMIPAGSPSRTFLLNMARGPICWIAPVLWASDTARFADFLLLLSGLCLLLGALSAVLYRTSGSRGEMVTFQVFFYIACVPAGIAGLFMVRSEPLAATLCPLAVVLMWGIGEWTNVLFLRLAAASALVLTLQSIADVTFKPSFFALHSNTGGPFTWVADFPTVYGLSALFATLLLYVGKVLLPLEIGGTQNVRPSISVQLPSTPPRVVLLPMHGPLTSPYPYRKAQHGSFASRACGVQNLLVIIPGIIALVLYGMLSLASANTTISAFLCAFAVLSIASVLPKEKTYIAFLLSVVAFVGRFLLTINSGSFFISFLELISLILLALSTAPVLRNVMSNRPAREGIDASVAGLYATFALQGMVTFIAWASPHDIAQGTVIMTISLLMTILAALLVDRIWVIIGAVIVTIDLALLLNSMNPLMLMIIAIILISGVVWRLLTRDKKNPPTDAGHNGMPQPSAPLPYNPQDHAPAPVQGMGAPQGEPQQYYPQQQPPLSADYAQGQQWQGQQYSQQ